MYLQTQQLGPDYIIYFGILQNKLLFGRLFGVQEGVQTGNLKILHESEGFIYHF